MSTNRRMTLDEFIARLGRDRVAAHCGVKPETIYKWQVRGLPGRFQFAILTLAKEEKLRLSAETIAGWLKPEVTAA